MNDNQDGWQNACCCCVYCCGHSNSVIFNQISSKFHIWVPSIKLSFKFKYGFCLISDNQDDRQNGCHLSVCTCVHCCGHSESFLIVFLSISNMDCFYLTLIQVWIWVLSNNQDGQQNGRCRCVNCHAHSNSVIFNQISSKFHTWIPFIKLSFKFEYGFCLMNDYQDGQQNGCLLSIWSYGLSTLVIYYPIASGFVP